MFFLCFPPLSTLFSSQMKCLLLILNNFDENEFVVLSSLLFRFWFETDFSYLTFVASFFCGYIISIKNKQTNKQTNEQTQINILLAKAGRAQKSIRSCNTYLTTATKTNCLLNAFLV